MGCTHNRFTADTVVSGAGQAAKNRNAVEAGHASVGADPKRDGGS